MTPRRAPAPPAVLMIVLVATSCRDDGSGNGDASFSTTVSTTTTMTTTESSPTADSTDEETASGGTIETSGNGTDGDASETSNSEPDLGICEDYVACAMETMPEVIATIIATYGPEGTCWTLPGVTEEDCWTECSAQMSDLRNANPDVVACWECQSDAFCGDATPWCNLVEHECTDDLATCDLRSDEAQCFEGPAAMLTEYCAAWSGAQGVGHCPIRSLLGTCRGVSTWGPDDALIYYYSTPLPNGEPPYTLATAQFECEVDGMGEWWPGPP